MTRSIQDRVPLTSAGLVLLVALPTAVWFLGIQNLDMVVLMGGLAALCVLVLLLVLVLGLGLVVRWRVGRHLQGTSLVLQTSLRQTLTWSPSGFKLRFPRFIPLVSLRWRWNLPVEVEVRPRGGQLEEHLSARRRGLWSDLTRHFELSDFLGLTRFRWRQAYATPVRILPDPGRLGQLPLLVRLASGEDISDPRGDPSGDRVDMRQYTRGDSPRTILWKVYARTRRLMVRVPERALTARPRVCAYLVCGPQDEPAAGLARVVLEKGLLGVGWRFGADGTSGHSVSLEEAMTRLAASGNSNGQAPLPNCPDSELLPFLRQSASDGFSMCVVFLPPDPGPGQVALTRALAQSPIPTSLFLAIDGVSTGRPPSRWRRWLVGQADSTQAASLQQAARNWAQHRGEVLLVDRQAGVLVGDLRVFLKEEEPVIGLLLAMLAWGATAWVYAEQWVPLGATRMLAALGAVLGVLAARGLRSLKLRLLPCWGLGLALGGLILFLCWSALWLEAPSQWLGPEATLLGVTAASWALLWGLAALGLHLTASRVHLFRALEALVVCSGFVGLLAGHRQGFISRPFFLVDPLWSQGYDPLPFFLAIGAALALVGAAVCASHNGGGRAWSDLLLVAALLVLAFLLIPVQRLKDLPQMQPPSGGAAGQKPSSGSGSPQPSPEDKQDFADQSAPHQNPPVAVVLFRDDYTPESGYYYLRQTATSQFNGVRLVRATDSHYDADLADRFPVGRSHSQDDVAVTLPQLDEGAFQPLETRVALMSQHAQPFALANAQLFWAEDNPDPKRFQKAYGVRSQVLTLPYKAMVGRRAGDSHWDRAEWAHYTAGPDDPRYQELVGKILADLPKEHAQEPFMRAVWIKLWLDNHTTYSLTSKSADSPDPVGGFLFGDRTGYCVYLSHSACYLWRAAGIPSRLASGYAVPASEKGKGSALLVRGRNSHSWPEIYLEGLGWIPLDVSPQKSLVPPEEPVDSSLQQMMGDMARNKPAPDKPRGQLDLQKLLLAWLRALVRSLPYLLAALVLSGYLGKLYRRLAPYLVAESRLPVAALRCLLDRLAERGALREAGQSREDFARQLADRCPSLTPLTRYNLAARLRQGGAPRLGRAHYLELLKLDLWPQPWYRRVLAVLDPISWWKVR